MFVYSKMILCPIAKSKLIVREREMVMKPCKALCWIILFTGLTQTLAKYKRWLCNYAFSTKQ